MQNSCKIILFLIKEILGNVHLKKYQKFVEEYSTHLASIEDALGDSINDSWDFTCDPVSLQVYIYQCL